VKPRSLNYDTPPGLEVAAGSRGKVVRLSGQWTALARDRVRRGSAVLDATRVMGIPHGLRLILPRALVFSILFQNVGIR